MNRLRHLLAHGHVNWALADQAVVSGCNFATGILLARLLGPEAFGLFVLLNAAMFYVNSFQGALIFTPMASAAPQLPEAQRTRYLQGIFALQLTLSFGLALLALGLGEAVLALDAFHLSTRLDHGILLALAAAMLAFQLQDLQRRYYFVLEKSRAAFANDLLGYGGQVTLLAIFGLRGTLDVGTAFAAIAASSITAFALGFLFAKVRPALAEARGVLRDGWRTGRDYLVAWQFQWVGTQGVLLVGGAMLGAQAAGGVRAAQNILGPINILFLAMDNVVPVMAARRYAERGLPQLTAFVWRITLLGTAVLLPVLLTLAFFAEPITHAVYGALYADSASLVVLQACYVFLQFHLRQVFFFLRTLTATGVIIRAGIVMAVCAIAVALLVIERYREPGIMFAYLCGTVVALVYSLAAARKLARQAGAGSAAVAAEALQGARNRA